MSDAERSAVEELSARRSPPARLLSAARGCLLGGALGDALGAPVEFDSLASIRRKHGPRGVTGMLPAYGRVGAITDDTQMTLFTAEGLIRAAVSRSQRGKSRGVSSPLSVVRHAYSRWLHTQNVPWKQAAGSFWSASKPEPDGWLVKERWLHSERAPGNTCLSALRATGETDAQSGFGARNDSKGCGGVMRMAPVGLLSHAGSGGEIVPVEGIFRLGVECAALTHGHPTGQLAAGALAATIHSMVHDGHELFTALTAALVLLRRRKGFEETYDAINVAIELGELGDPTPEKVESLGGGWVAEEALAIGVYAALSHPDDVRSALLLAVNHSGDSDSTGAICGNLLGAQRGLGALPRDWLEVVEGRETIRQLADDLVAEDQGTRPCGEDCEADAPSHEWCWRYPGW